jgi:ABC-type multidrug transport system ATPase subunit
MEEADVLANHIGIMAKGVLRCLGTALHLKRKYGRGFKLTVAFRKEEEVLREQDKSQGAVMSSAEATKFIESVLPANQWTKVEQSGIQGSAIYEFDDSTNEARSETSKGVIFTLIDTMEQMKDKLGVEDWGISQTSLEEVFLNIVKEDDADASAE